MVIVTCAGTGWPFRVAGSYWYCFRDSTAEARNDGGPESTLTKFTSPLVPTTASITTFPRSKSFKASIEATARTDLINFGGTTPLSLAEGTTAAEVTFAAGRSAEGFSAVTLGRAFRFTAGCATEPLDPEGSTVG